MYQRKTQRIWNGWQPPTSNPLSSSLVQQPPVPNPLSFSLVQEGLRKILDAHTDFTAGQCCSLSEHHPARRRTADDASATEGGACQRSGRRCVRRRRRRGAQPLSRTKSGAQWRTKSGAQRAIAPWDAAHGAGGGARLLRQGGGPHRALQLASLAKGTRCQCRLEARARLSVECTLLVGRESRREQADGLL